MPVEVLVPFPAIVMLRITKDRVSTVPSTRIPVPSTLLIAQGPITNGSPVVPLPEVTHWQAAKSASCRITIGACEETSRARAVMGNPRYRRQRMRADIQAPPIGQVFYYR